MVFVQTILFMVNPDNIINLKNRIPGCRLSLYHCCILYSPECLNILSGWRGLFSKYLPSGMMWDAWFSLSSIGSNISVVTCVDFRMFIKYFSIIFQFTLVVLSWGFLCILSYPVHLLFLSTVFLPLFFVVIGHHIYLVFCLQTLSVTDRMWFYLCALHYLHPHSVVDCNFNGVVYEPIYQGLS